MLCAVTGILALVAALPACAADLFLIVHPGTEVTPADVASVFRGEKQFAGGVMLTPVDNLAAQELFLATVMRMDGVRYGALWIRKSFRDGLNRPEMKSSDADVIDFVRRTPGAVGYTQTVRPGVSILERF